MDAAKAEGAGTQPTEDEIREYARQLRVLPVEQIIADTLSSLLSGAQAKLGRRDARLLIDLTTVSLTHARDHLSQDLVRQVEDVLGQLRLAQVTAEGRNPGEVEENDLDRVPAPPASGATTPPVQPSRPTPTPTPTPPPSAASRLWVPGR
ncbi:MAG TPA: hypothetical protein VF053_19105 [Streptosporangiales bacterium]